MAENLNVFDFALSDDEMAKITALDQFLFQPPSPCDGRMVCEDGGRAEEAAGFFKRKEELVGKTNSIWIIYPIIKYE